MQDWKRLPAYKAEPRIDSFIGYYLPAIVTAFCGEEIIGVIPELPIRLATIKPHYIGTASAEKSYKVDFYLLAKSGRHYFVEFKTDSGSRREKQDQYLAETSAKGMTAIVEGIIKIAAVSSYKTKYGHLLSKLKEMGLIDDNSQFTGQSDTIEVLYVQPHHQDGDTKTVIDFAWIARWLKDKYGANEFEAALSSALALWATD